MFIKSYNSGGYMMKQIEELFNVHYSLLSRLVVRNRKLSVKK
ncbi:hypothetical protein C427_3434 [Paraglaciecola psychrophila 170]|uniref:Uncharacterized protein n=1 Tax=Paraglaciecola psychrophila 170 TaxID=1129794 RepID=M4RSB5_9ALTE|nr:hypothetical protein C427_3434 [Paraglaciecola psychrophila 170]